MNKKEFLNNLDNMSNHRVLLWEALELTKGDVIEFGSGYGSTAYLEKYCKETGRSFASFDSNKEWALKTGAIYLENWEDLQINNSVDLLFLDHAPGERRQFDLVKYKDIAKIIVIHDSEPTGAGDYRVRQHFSLFKYKCEILSSGAWATALSNFIDLTPCIGKKFGEYEIYP